MAPAASKLTADCQTPLQLQWCLQRRGLALDLNHVISWETHERWVAFLMQSLAQEVPSGYANISIDQILKADCELFLLVSKDIKRVKVGPDGTMEADVALNKLKTHPRVTMHLLPLRSPGKATGSNQVPNDVPEFADAPSRPKKRRTLDNKRGLMAPVKTTTMPPELKACPYYTDANGRRSCWGFNLGTCALATKGTPPACQKGVHVCMTCRKPGHGHSQCWHAQKGGKGSGSSGKGKKGGKQGADPPGDSCLIPGSVADHHAKL